MTVGTTYAGAICCLGYDVLAGQCWRRCAAAAGGPGPGRIAAPLQRLRPDIELSGVDVDWQAIDWCGANLPGRYHLIQPAGRLPFDDRTFRAAYAFNVFTHLGEHEQVDRLSEIHRVLNPGGALIVTTRPPELLAAVPESAGKGTPVAARARIRLLHPCGSGDFNDRLAFQSREYLRDTWAPWFRLTDYRRAGFRRRDVAIFERHAGPSCARVRRMRWNRKVRLRGKAAS